MNKKTLFTTLISVSLENLFFDLSYLTIWDLVENALNFHIPHIICIYAPGLFFFQMNKNCCFKKSPIGEIPRNVDLMVWSKDYIKVDFTPKHLSICGKYLWKN